MCELLVRVVDKVNPNDPLADLQCHKAGDVIVAVDDGHQWGRAEVANPEWRIVRVPGASIADVSGLLAEEPQVQGLPEAVRARRGFRLDLDALSDQMTLAELRAATYRATTSNPAVL